MSENKKKINVMINESNQVCLSDLNDTQVNQLNAAIVMLSPYKLENLDFSDWDISLCMDGDDFFFINGKRYELLEVKPGLKVVAFQARD